MMGQKTGPLLAIAAIGALGAYTPPEDVQRNVYSDLDDCQRDFPGSGCVRDGARAVGPWYAGDKRAALSAIGAMSTLAVGVIGETRRGGFGWSCGDRGGGGG